MREVCQGDQGSAASNFATEGGLFLASISCMMQADSNYDSIAPLLKTRACIMHADSDGD